MIPIKKRLIPLYENIATNFMGKTFNRPSDKIAFIFLAGDYSNLGDLAIRYAQEKFINNILPDYTVVSMSQSDTYIYLKSIRQQLNKNDIIFLQGGGNFGDLYPKADYGRLFICNFFNKSKICVFPQTILFTSTKYGDWRKKSNVNAIKKQPNLTIFTRENKSYKIARNLFHPEKVQLCPDIVLSLLPSIRENKDSIKRSGIIVTLRSDIEKSLSERDRELIIQSLIQSGNKLQYLDTDKGDSGVVSMGIGLKKVKNFLNKYSASELVVTDRLHGMIFATITGTPCIVLSNSNHKIEGTYKDWLKDCNYIKFIGDFSIDKFNEQKSILLNKSFKSNYGSVELSFQNLKKYVRQISN